MSTALQLGPDDHGRAITLEEFNAAEYRSGNRYEIIDGRLYVSPFPNPAHDWIERYVLQALLKYSEVRPDVINCVTGKARVFVQSSQRTTAPQPDVAAYRDFPVGPRFDWRDVSPILVVEVLGGDSEYKDLTRNVDLYLEVPSIQEYWVFDIRDDPEQPRLRAHRRRDNAWQVIEHGARETYATDFLPGLRLPVSPPRD